ncbi:Gypsy retrotransposon integrase protein 1 [Fasciola hepatica]|uniref:Gypsy retrotransposon integrase protein 1 n=1 Tax=Fasciola hepatica TaxID=6192 RepID=A0A4E0RAY4_FASHE|nr:Gypsy retrotransposon integrase protein 1 [Fasciola hepatica]
MQAASAKEKACWSVWNRIKVMDGVLYTDSPEGPKSIIPLTKAASILQRIHEQLGHGGQLKTEAAVRRRYWWPGIHADSVKLCNTCGTCATIKNYVPSPKAPMEVVNAGEPGQRDGIDIMEPLPMSKDEDQYVLVMIDYFTKWSEAVALRFQDANSVADAFIRKWVGRYGAPEHLHSDQGSAFESQMLREVCGLLGVKKTRTTPYHPQSNGLVECTNRTIEALLQSFIDNRRTNRWDELLPMCMIVYRASCHGTTQFSPAFLTLGRELRLPIELLTSVILGNVVTTMDHTQQLHRRMQEAFRVVRVH